MNAQILVFVICAEAIIYLLLNNLHDNTLSMCELLLPPDLKWLK